MAFLLAGFVAVEVVWGLLWLEDAFCVEPEELLEEFKIKAQDGWDGLSLRVNRVPDILRKMDYIGKLSLTFDGKVVIPEWMDEKKIGSLTINGNMTAQEKAELEARFPDAQINRWR